MAKAPDAFRTISEVAEELELPQHVLRFWETRFTQIKPMKRGGGRRYYRPEDVDLLRGVRLLLYGEGFTIRGVQRLLKDKGVGFVVAVGQTGSVETVATAEGAGAIDRGDADEAADVEVAAPEVKKARRAPVPPAPQPLATPAPTTSKLPPEGRRRLEAALSDLIEARELLESAR